MRPRRFLHESLHEEEPDALQDEGRRNGQEDDPENERNVSLGSSFDERELLGLGSNEPAARIRLVRLN